MQDDSGVTPDVISPEAIGSVVSVDRLLHSDPHDFAGLYIRHRASFTLHARRYLKDARDADEVVQEAFLRLFLALPELDTELQALAYCRRTITNLCIDRFRAQARRPSLVDLESAGDLAEDDPGDPVVRAEDAAMVREALSLLSPLHRAALVKREIEEKTLPVIAQELDIPEESVKHVLFRARRALRRILAGTSLVPGSDAELGNALGKAVRAGSGGVAAFLLFLFVGLGTGPDLRAIPVVGTDLPELINVTEIATAVGDAVVVVADGVASVVTSDSDSGSPTVEAADEPVVQEPLTGLVPSPSASPTAHVVTTPTASVSPSVSASPTASALASLTPSTSPSATASPIRSASASPSPSATSSPTDEPEPSPSASASTKSTGKPKPSPSPSPSVAPSPEQQDSPDSYQTDGLEYVLDPKTGELVRVPLGQTAETWRA